MQPIAENVSSLELLLRELGEKVGRGEGPLFSEG
jgi:hypothetical protein